MLYYDRIDVSQGVDDDNTNNSHKYIICNYYYLLSVNFRFQPKVWRFNDVITVSVKGNYCRIFLWYMNKDEVVNWINNVYAKEKKSNAKKWFYFLRCIV